MRTLPVVAFASLATAAFLLYGAPANFSGRWDLTLTTDKQTYPSWLEIQQTEGKTEVHIVGRVASVHPASDVQLNGNHLTFQSQEYFGKQMPVTWDVTLAGGKLTGTQKRDDGTVAKLAGVPAPALKRAMPAKWSKPEPIFNGKDLTGWVADEPEKNHWKASNGELLNESGGANIRTSRNFQDFKLHIEYNCPDKGNSGVYLRGRYEVQVEYEPVDANDPLHGMGSIYGFLAPEVKLDKTPGQWESYDVTLVGRTVTVERNGKMIHNNREIPGITGGALNSREADPGPLYIQGDHTGGMKYRNITVAVPAK